MRKIFGVVLFGLAVGLVVTPSLKAQVSAYNVKDYGAVGNGSTDDGPSIQNAIDNASAAGGPQDVYFPPGTYLVGTRLYQKTNASWYGSGAGAILKVGTSSPYKGTADNVTIRFLEFDGNKATFTGSYGLETQGSNVIVQGNYMHDFAKAHVEPCGTGNHSNIKILNNWMRDTGPAGFWGPIGVVNGQNVLIMGNLCTGVMAYAIDYSEPNYVGQSIDNVTLQYNHSRKGSLSGSTGGAPAGSFSNVYILDNDIDSAGNFGGGESARVAGATGTIQVIGNTFRTYKHYNGCLTVSGPSPLIQNNFCSGIGTLQYNNGSYNDAPNVGISLGNCTGGNVSNNTIAADAPTNGSYVAGIVRSGGTAPTYSGNAFYNITNKTTDNMTYLGGVYNVKDSPYNAVGDNSTDDTAHIQAAIDAASSAGGGIVFFPIGTYLSGTLTVKSNIAFRGEGRDTILSVKNNLNSYLLGTADSSAAVDNVSIKLFTIDGNKANNTSGSAIQFGGSNITISGMHIYNIADAAVNIGNNNTVNNVMIRNNFFENCGRSGNNGGGLLIRMGSNVNAIANVVSNTDGYTKYIIKVDAASGKTVSALNIQNNYARGGCIMVQGSGTKSNVTITDNDIDSINAAGTPDGIYVTGATGAITVTNNCVRCPSTTSPGIYLASMSSPTVNYNYVTGMGTQQQTNPNNVGILLSSVTGGTVSNNKIFAAAMTQYGYNAGIKRIGSSGLTISNNKFYNLNLVEEGPITGRVILGDYDPLDPTVPVGVRIQLMEGGIPVRTELLILEQDGSFTLDNVTSDEYDIGIKAATWLKKVIHIPYSGHGYDLGTIELINGDLHGDNEVGSTSLSIVLSQLGQMGDE